MSTAPTPAQKRIERDRTWKIQGDAAMDCEIRRTGGSIEIKCPERSFSRVQGYFGIAEIQSALAQAMDEILDLGRQIHGEAAITNCHKCGGEIFVESFDASRLYYCLNTFHKLCHEYESDLARVGVVPKHCYRSDCKRWVRGKALGRFDGRATSFCCTQCKEGTGDHTSKCESNQETLSVEMLP